MKRKTSSGVLVVQRMNKHVQHVLMVMLSVLCCFLGILNTCVAAEFNNQLMPRITERLDDYFEKLVDLVQSVIRFHETGGFTGGADRQAIFDFIRALSFKIPKMVYVLLDDGTVVSWLEYPDDSSYIMYQEPGNSGYEIPQPGDASYKHWVSCFNNTNGIQQNCLLDTGDSFVECVNDCELIPCTSSDKGIEATIETTLCRNYVIKQVQEGEARGYKPMFTMCINELGEPEQRPGFVIKNRTSNELGNCYYGDNVTVVNNSLSGDYAACGGGGAVCDNALHGALFNEKYDARYREFFLAMKKKQKPDWTDPFVYIGGRMIAIGFEHPLYSAANGTTDSSSPDDKVFEGMIAADYSLQYVTEFLTAEYADTEIKVLVVENNPPYYIVATSTNEALVKPVLINDETLPCPDKSITEFGIDEDLCKPVRKQVVALKDSENASERIFHRAFAAHQMKNFPTNSTVNMKESDSIGSPAFVSQGKLYNLPYSDSDSVKWHVIAILPMSRATNDAAMPGDASFAIISFVGSLGFVGCFVLFLKFFNRRKEPAMIYADWRFTCAFILGCTALNLSSFTLLGANTNTTCMLRMWSFHGLFACAISPLFVKVWRMAILMKAGRGCKRTVITNFTAFLFTLPLIIIQLLILFVFSFVDPPRQNENLGVGVGIGVQQITCDHRTNAFFITQVVFDGILIFAGCVLAYKTKDLDPRFGEAKQLGFSLYNIAFTGIVTVATASMVDLDQESQIILQAVGVFWGSFFSTFSFVLPRLLEVAKEKELSSKHLSDSTNHNISGLNWNAEVESIEFFPISPERPQGTHNDDEKKLTTISEEKNSEEM